MNTPTHSLSHSLPITLSHTLHSSAPHFVFFSLIHTLFLTARLFFSLSYLFSLSLTFYLTLSLPISPSLSLFLSLSLSLSLTHTHTLFISLFLFLSQAGFIARYTLSVPRPPSHPTLSNKKTSSATWCHWQDKWSKECSVFRRMFLIERASVVMFCTVVWTIFIPCKRYFLRYD